MYMADKHAEFICASRVSHAISDDVNTYDRRRDRGSLWCRCCVCTVRWGVRSLNGFESCLCSRSRFEWASLCLFASLMAATSDWSFLSLKIA